MIKRIFAILLLTVTVLSASAAGHFKFMGIEINGPKATFIQKLRAKGFTLSKHLDSECSIMKGTFAGKKAELYVFATPKTKTVYKVAVFFPEHSNWDNLKNEYTALKEVYDSKYNLDSDYSFFISPYYEGDGYEMQAVRADKCRYTSFYFFPEGAITLEISQWQQVSVDYQDNANFDLRDREETKKVYDDI